MCCDLNINQKKEEIQSDYIQNHSRLDYAHLWSTKTNKYYSNDKKST